MDFLKKAWGTKTGKVLICGVGVILFLALLSIAGVLPEQTAVYMPEMLK